MSGRGIIGIDWGSTGFRAYRFGDDGAILETKSSIKGIKSVAPDADRPAAFASIFKEELGDWLSRGIDRVILSGMITSRNGWVETSYAKAPATEADLAKGVVTRIVDGIELAFLPGVSVAGPVADVMRGEEVQVFGADLGSRPSLVVLPGTHSKWAHIADGRIENFATFVTGELFDLLRNKSLIGGLAVGDDFHELAFLEGVDEALEDVAQSGGLVRRLFGARASVLVAGKAATEVSSYLSGLLIGNEIHEADRMFGAVDRVSIVGSEILEMRYALAMKRAGIATTTGLKDAAARGLYRIAGQLGLVE
jgi:2-dehydro-3-deoxygalactonokinase